MANNVDIRAGSRTMMVSKPWERRARTIVAVVVATMIAILGLVVPSAAVAAPVTSGGITFDLDYGGESYGDRTVVAPGVPYTGELSYDLTKVEPGSAVAITIPEGVTIPGDLPAGNESLADISLNGNQLTITFADEFDNNQGFFNFEFQFTEPESGSRFEDVTWSLDDQTKSDPIIVKDPGDEFRPDLGDGLAKNVGNHDLGSAISVNEDGEVTLGPGVTEIPIPYTLTVTSTTDRTVTISDTIDDYLSYDHSSFTAAVVSWDENGLNRSEAPFPFPTGQPAFDGQGFTLEGLEIPANSVVQVSYDAHVNVDQIDALEGALQAEADEIASATGGGFGFMLTNQATLDGGNVQDGGTWIGGHRPAEPQPGPDGVFDKSSTFDRQYVVNPGGEAAGAFSTLPIRIPYTLAADLTGFADADNAWDQKWGLTGNVVLRDQLPEGMAWDAASLAANDALTLVGATDPLDNETFSAQTSEGDYYLDEATRTLWVNLGQDVTRNWAIDATAVIDSEEDLAKLRTWDEHGNPQIATRHVAENTANFFYWDGRDGTHQIDKQVINDLDIIAEAESTIEDESEFSKTIGDLPQMTVGEAYQVPYTFRLEEGAIIDLAQSQIIDAVNSDVFDLSDLDAIRATISGTYDYQGSLTGDDFDLTVNDAGELVFTTSDTFGAGLPDWYDLAESLTKRVELTFSLPTHVIQGKQTIDVSNSARVEGGTTNEYTWENDAQGSATSFGNELEVKKSIYEGDGEWTQNFRVELDDDGNPVQSEFIYRVQLLPHGDYEGRAILDIVDTLPAGTELLGFVDDAQLETGNTRAEDQIDIDGNLRVTMDRDAGEAGTVVISQIDGTGIQGTPYVNFKIELTDPQADIGVVNKIGGTQAVITPTDGYPLLIAKSDAQRPDMVITDRDARFTVTGPTGETITDEAFVVEGQLMVLDEDGEESGIVIPENEDGGVPAGEYTIVETEAPKGYELNETPIVVTIDEDGSSSSVTIFDEPKTLYAIGDYTWIDANRDGLQSDGEEMLPGVTVELLDVESGEVLDTTETDENGFYLFDLLDEGDYRVRFTLTDEQAAQYAFTSQTGDDDATLDSDADPVTGESGVITMNGENDQLVSSADYANGTVKALEGIDPTWDAGVVQKSYAIGDYTWFDANRDGLQGADEQVFPGMAVELFDANGEPATHVDGSVVESTQTNEQGFYLFDELPAGDYQVRFTIPEEQRGEYRFTVSGDGSAEDSDAVVTDDDAVGTTVTVTLGDDNANLTTEYETADVTATEGIDPTWDAGVVGRSYAVGDFVWIDENRDGLQGTDEPVLEDVTVTLTNPETGETIAETVTDENGRYLFDLLPEGDYQVSFTLTPEQQDEFDFTAKDAQSDDPNDDSDADPETGMTDPFHLGPDTVTEGYAEQEFDASEGIDPTWDAGVIRKEVSVGDYVWLDEDKDGRQGPEEPGIEDVCLTLVGPDGEPVIDVDGNPVDPTCTDENGYYSFDNLPALPEGQHYTVIVEDPEGYEPTTPGDGDREGDSSIGSAESRDLTEDGDRDDTLDFGYVLPEPTPAPEDPTPTPEEPTPAPEDPTPAPEEPTPAPEEPTPAPEDPTPAPEDPTPTPEEPTPAPEDPTPAPEEPTPAPEEPTPAPEEDSDELNPTGEAVALSIAGAALLMLAAGAVLFLTRRRAQQ